MARAKTDPQKTPVLSVRTFKLTREADETLQQLRQDASDALGRAISGSAVVRALLRLAAQRQLASQLVNLVEAELDSGVLWGKPK